MNKVVQAPIRRTSADEVFQYLRDQIVSLALMPGTRISEVEVAKSFEISRQPVREAFIRLSEIDLIKIRPQKATLVSGFSYEAIQRSRFIRMAVECETIRRACKNAGSEDIQTLRQALNAQADAIEARDTDRFHKLDYEFHHALCGIADCEFAFQTILDNKVTVDRLCLLSLAEATEMDKLLADHTQIVDCLEACDEEAVVSAVRKHLARLDSVIEGIRKSHESYFED